MCNVAIVTSNLIAMAAGAMRNFANLTDTRVEILLLFSAPNCLTFVKIVGGISSSIYIEIQLLLFVPRIGTLNEQSSNYELNSLNEKEVDPTA